MLKKIYTWPIEKDLLLLMKVLVLVYKSEYFTFCLCENDAAFQDREAYFSLVRISHGNVLCLVLEMSLVLSHIYALSQPPFALLKP